MEKRKTNKNSGGQEKAAGNWAKLGDVARFEFGTRITRGANAGTQYPVYGGGGESFRTDLYNRENDYVISRFAMSPNCVRFVKGKFFLLDSGLTLSLAPEFADRVSKHFIGFFLLGIQHQIYRISRGQAQKNLDSERFRKIEIPMPPLSEQRRIVARLRQELQDCDKINRVVESEFEKTRQISVALLRDAFRKMKINRCPFVALAKIIAEATSGFACGQRDPKGIVQVRMHNISNEFALVWETVTRIPKRALDPKHYFLPGDIVFNNTNSAALVGKSALFVGGKEPIVFSNHMTRLRVDREICLPEFLLLYLRDQWNQGLFSRICARWVGQSAVRSAKLMQLSIPLPPMAEQRRIVNFLHAQLEDIAKISAAVERQLESARALPQAVLRRAFS